MLRHVKVFIVSVFVLLLVISSILVIRVNESYNIHKKISTKTTNPYLVSFNLPTSIKSIRINDDSAANIWWVPYNQKSVLSHVSLWLDSATPYTGKITQLYEVGIRNAYVGPARITLATGDNHLIVIYPAYYIEKSGKADTAISKNKYGVVTTSENLEFQVQYVKDVLVFNNKGIITYLKSEPLYNWLKQDQWKKEFERG